ncbi:MAG: TonB-dependent receptor [Maricaulis sp.]|nr:TonB-dependent receptor [Maricaulis sp.]
MSAAPVLAQEIDDADGVEDRDIIIVSATRTEIPAFDYPGMVSVVDVETLELTDPSSLDELLREIPGLEVSGGPRRTGQTITLRGQSRENVIILLDGARQNFNSAHDGVTFVDPALLVGVDVVRGPASALYGSGASGGVIALRTANAHDLLSDDANAGFRATLGGRSVDGEIRGGATIFGRNGNFDALAHLSARQSSDIRLGSGVDLPADDSSLSGLLKLGADIASGVRGEVSWQTLRSEASEPNNGQGNLGIGGLNPQVNKDITSDTVQLNAQIAPSQVGWLDLDFTLFSTQSGVEETETIGGRLVDRQLDSWGVRADQRFEFTLGSMDAGLTVGGEMYEDEQEGFDSTAVGNVRGGVPDASTRFQGIFAQLELTGAAPFGLPGEFVLLPGVRFDNYESETIGIASNEDSATSGRFGVSYAPNDTVLLFANWAQAFRAPSVNEIYLDGTHFSLPHPILGPPVFITNDFIANPTLSPESTETVEIGIGLRFTDMARDGDSLEVKASIFETQAEDLINLFVNFNFDPTCFAGPPFLPCSAGITNSANVGRATLTGFEVLANYRSGPFSLNASLSETDGEDDATSAPVGALTPLRLFVDARWRMEAQRLTFGARGEFAGEFDKTATPAEERNGYSVIDLYTSWRPFADNGLSLNASVNNVFDEDYNRVFAGVSEAGRGVRADITWSTEW